MVTDQNHSYIDKHDSLSSTRIFGLDEQNVKVYSVLSKEIRALDKKLNDYHSKYNSLKKTVKRLERDLGSQKIKLDGLDECVDRETVVDLIHEIVPSLINEKGKSSSDPSDSSEESDSVKIRERKAVPYKQRRKAQLRKVKIKKAISSLK
ncbi:28711_t:CDS:1 [Racocetra persica]|uniref:28711_t:CDS:1 n=1 Tax=Racocetra persica TaxID=160502 RepID=A0ACA9M037_9GLOM|nr:28711_t:CDS:1 [Racocetra persica]